MKNFLTLAAFFAVLSIQTATAKCDEIADQCEMNLAKEYISDGQFYRALLYNDQVAEFELSLFGGNTYRIAACSGMDSGNFVFRLYDQEHNLLFTSSDFSNAPYWDFVVENTMQCTIEAQLDLNKQQSGCAVLLIGFKK